MLNKFIKAYKEYSLINTYFRTSKWNLQRLLIMIVIKDNYKYSWFNFQKKKPCKLNIYKVLLEQVMGIEFNTNLQNSIKKGVCNQNNSGPLKFTK